MKTKIKNIAKNIVKADDSVSVYLNPFNTNFTLKISKKITLKDAAINIYDVCGKEIKSVSINKYKTIVSRKELKRGTYFYSTINNNNKIAEGKLIVHKKISATKTK